MRLTAWLRENDKTVGWLAEQIGRDQSSVSRLKDGHIRPSNSVAAAIHRLTDGAVTSIDHEDAFLERNAPATSEQAA